MFSFAFLKYTPVNISDSHQFGPLLTSGLSSNQPSNEESLWLCMRLFLGSTWRQKHDVPDRIAVLLKDLIAFRKRVVRMRECTNDVVSRNASGYMSIHIDMVNAP